MNTRNEDDLRRIMYTNHDNCIICNHRFQDCENVSVGFDEKNNPLITCEKCSINIDPDAISVYSFTERHYKIPNFESTLWRYMDFSKYMSLLTTRSLYFARADTFEDPYEGAFGSLENKEIWENLHKEQFNEILKNPIMSKEVNINCESNRLINDLLELNKMIKKKWFISCWHENSYESEAMWRLYSSFFANAIAIKTTFRHLYDSLGRDINIEIGKIEYIDYKKNFAPVNGVFWRKRKSFEHEKEVRAMFFDMNENSFGKLIPCDLNILIQEVYISPSAPSWFKKLIEDVNLKFELNAKIVQSDLNSPCF
ncbi:Uncharacterised protein [Neisseria subflava]|nr:Uncharacterised protein [Neisseria subflava]